MGFTTSPVELGIALGTEESSANTADTVVKRDSSGNFAAGTITASLTGNVTGNATGNAGTATRWQTARDMSLTGDVTATLSSVDGSAAVSAAATIANDAVTADKLRDDASTDANRAVTTNHIRNNSVTAAKLGSDVPVIRAWVNFNATRNSTDTAASANGGDVLIRSSYGVSSVTRTTIDEYTINFSPSLTDDKYAWYGSVGRDGNATQAFVSGRPSTAIATWKTATALTVGLMQSGGTDLNAAPADVSVVVIR